MSGVIRAEDKAVIVIAPHLGIGLAANRAAVLATGLAAHVPGIIGENPQTKDGVDLLGFTRAPIPILNSRPDQSLLDMVRQSQDLGCTTIVFLTRAQGMRSYDEYLASIGRSDFETLDVDGIALYGSKKAVNKLTGNLPALR